MESDSAEKADTQRGSCYSHLLASVSAALSGPLIQAAPVISWLFTVFIWSFCQLFLFFSKLRRTMRSYEGFDAESRDGGSVFLMAQREWKANSFSLWKCQRSGWHVAKGELKKNQSVPFYCRFCVKTTKCYTEKRQTDAHNERWCLYSQNAGDKREREKTKKTRARTKRSNDISFPVSFSRSLMSMSPGRINFLLFNWSPNSSHPS